MDELHASHPNDPNCLLHDARISIKSKFANRIPARPNRHFIQIPLTLTLKAAATVRHLIASHSVIYGFFCVCVCFFSSLLEPSHRKCVYMDAWFARRRRGLKSYRRIALMRLR